MKRYIRRLFAPVLAVLLLCGCVITAAAREDTGRLSHVTVANGCQVDFLDGQDNVLAPAGDAQTGTDVYSGAVKLKLTVEQTLVQDYLVMLLNGGERAPADDNIRYIDQKSGAGSSLEFTVYPDRLTEAGDYHLMVFAGGTQTAAASFRVLPNSGTVTVLPAANGTVSVDKESGAGGELVTVTAVPDAGYELTAILVDGKAIGGNTFTISGDHEVTAVFARKVTASGYCGGEGDGKNLTWTLYADGELVISGTGTMADYANASAAPWNGWDADVAKITIEPGVTTIGNYAFAGAALSSVSIADGVRQIGWNAFEGCASLTSVVIPDSVTSFGSAAFKNCTALTGVRVSAGMSVISKYAFSGCISLTDVTIPEGVHTIGQRAFSDCRKLTGVIVPASVTKISERAFAGCTALTGMEFLGDVPGTVQEGIFENCNALSVYCHVEKTGWPDTGTWQGRPLLKIGAVKFAGSTVTMTEVIDVNLMFQKAALKGAAGAYVEIVGPGDEIGQTRTVRIEQADWGSYNSSLYKVTYQGLAARQMGQDIVATVYSADGVALSAPYTDSVRAYAGRALKSSGDAKLKKLIVDLLNYGAAAQTYFKYAADDLANNQLTQEQKALGTVVTKAYSDRSQKVLNNVGSTFNLKSRIELNMYFKKMTVTENTYALVRMTHHYDGAEEITVRIEGSEFDNSKASYTIVPIAEMVAADGRQLVTCEVYQGGTLVAKGVDSLESYVARAMKSNATTNKWLEEVLDFSDSAYNYQH